MNVIGDVGGRTCIIQDDIVDTAGTIVKAALALKENGAERVLACAVHGVLSGPAIERLEAAPIDQVIITNTIPLNSERARCCKKIKQLSVARLLGQAIRSIHEETSVSSVRSLLVVVVQPFRAVYVCRDIGGQVNAPAEG